MKRIERDKKFTKNYVLRIARSPKLQQQFEARVSAFLEGKKGSPVNDHALMGNKLGLRSFSISGNMRVIYKETEQAIIFLDIGTHNQVY